jgi:hypothetical protein
MKIPFYIDFRSERLHFVKKFKIIVSFSAWPHDPHPCFVRREFFDNCEKTTKLIYFFVAYIYLCFLRHLRVNTITNNSNSEQHRRNKIVHFLSSYMNKIHSARVISVTMSLIFCSSVCSAEPLFSLNTRLASDLYS